LLDCYRNVDTEIFNYLITDLDEDVIMSLKHSPQAGTSGISFGFSDDEDDPQH
jgi:hypothetical protein